VFRAGWFEFSLILLLFFISGCCCCELDAFTLDYILFCGLKLMLVLTITLSDGDPASLIISKTPYFPTCCVFPLNLSRKLLVINKYIFIFF
jgi:hypothetical protein